MNKTKPLLGISLATVLAIGIAGFAYAGTPLLYFLVDSADAVVNDDDYLFIANMNGTIPKNSKGDDFYIGGYPVWGIAWVDGTSTGSNFTAATIHPNIVDSRQNPDNWHPHTGTFYYNGTSDTLCIGTLESPHAGIAKNDDVLRVNIESESSDVTPSTAVAGVSFALDINNDDCPGVPVELPGQGLKPNAASPPLPGLQVIPIDLAGIP